MLQLECKDVSLGYEGKVIIKHLNFQVNSGDYLYIVGENGTGKSTLIKTILGLRAPLDGEITFSNQLKPTQIGYLPQQTQVQKDFPASVWEVVLSGNLNTTGFRPFYTREEKERACANMEKLGITEFKKRCYRDLSGGQQQRVLLARALCATGKMLLLDEPVAGLDPKITNEMYELIQKLNQEGITIIMVSHDMAAACKYADHILHIAHKPLFFGTREEYLKTDTGKAFTELVKMEQIGEEEDDR